MYIEYNIYDLNVAMVNKNIIKIRKCIVCNGYKTFITKNNRLLYINCEECKSINTIS